MSSAFLHIQSGLQTVLAAAAMAAGGDLQVNRTKPIAANQTAAIVLRLEQTGGTEGVIGVLDWVSTYAIECYARAAVGVDPAAAVDTMLLDVWARLAAIVPVSIGADLVALSPQVDWQYEEAETPLVCAVIRLTVSHSTTTDNLEPRA